MTEFEEQFVIRRAKRVVIQYGRNDAELLTRHRPHVEQERRMPPKRIICVADLDIPGPNTKTIVAKVKTMSAGRLPVTTEQVAAVLDCTVGQVEYSLNIAERVGLVKRVSQGWIAT